MVKCCREISEREHVMDSLRRLGVMGWIFGVVTLLGLGYGNCLGQEQAARPRTTLAVWDTLKPSAEMLSVEAIEKKSDWKPVTVGEPTDNFQGDAVISNGYLLAAVRKQGSGV